MVYQHHWATKVVVILFQYQHKNSPSQPKPLLFFDYQQEFKLYALTTTILQAYHRIYPMHFLSSTTVQLHSISLDLN